MMRARKIQALLVMLISSFVVLSCSFITSPQNDTREISPREITATAVQKAYIVSATREAHQVQSSLIVLQEEQAAPKSPAAKATATNAAYFAEATQIAYQDFNQAETVSRRELQKPLLGAALLMLSLFAFSLVSLSLDQRKKL